MKLTIRIILTAVCLFGSLAMSAKETALTEAFISEQLSKAASQALRLYSRVEPLDSMLADRTDLKGNFVPARPLQWTAGFFPGTLWYLYKASGNEQLAVAARKLTSRMEQQQYNTNTHDIGFMMNCSYGNALDIDRDSSAVSVLVKSAESLRSRFDPKVGCIRSWNSRKGQNWDYIVIIDNMMNLELLMRAAKLSGNTKFAEVAKSHADKTLKNHFRPDGSCCHVVDYDSVTGKSKGQHTAQGLADNSSWSRGQGWAVYGYTAMYRWTNDVGYLKQAEKTARFILSHPNTPADGIVYWDFDAPAAADTPRDASAAALIASAFLELSVYIKDDAFKKELVRYSSKVLKSLSGPEYTAAPGENGDFLLKHSTINKPGGNFNTAVVYADYYYVEALLRYKAILEAPSKRVQPILMAEYEKPGVAASFRMGKGALPYPSYSDRAGWKRFVGEAYAADVIASGEQCLGWKWNHVPAQAFIQTQSSGSHALKHIETNNRKALVRLALAEAVEGKGRFLKDLADGFWFYSTSYHWTLVSDTGSSVLPSSDHEKIGLGSGRSGQTLATIWYIFGDEFDKIDPMIGITFKESLKRLILDPYLDNANDAKHWWLGKPKKRRLNNHTPWNTCSVLTCFFVAETDRTRLDAAIRKSLEAVDIYINDFPADGLCDEGPTYWFNSVGRLCALLQLLRDASGGKFEVMPNSRISKLGSYISRCCGGQNSKGREIVANYGDAEPFVNFDASILWASGKMLGSRELEDLALFSLWDGKKFKRPGIEKSEGYRAFENLRYSREIELSLSDLNKRMADGERSQNVLASLRNHVPESSYYPYGGQVFVNTSDGWFFSGKAAWNNEAHNHNDAGSFMLFSEGTAIFIDPGVGEYTEKTFSPLRYTIWTMNSDWHNLPLINGIAENHGGIFRTKNAEFVNEKGEYRFSCDIQDAYSRTCDCKLWSRTYRLSTKGGSQLEITDRFQLNARKAADVEHFIVQGAVELISPGVVRISNKGKVFELSFPKELLQFSTDIQDDLDNKLKSVWGKCITRINLTSAPDAPLDGEYKIRIKQISN